MQAVIQLERQSVGTIPDMGEPFGATDHTIELIAVDHQKAFAVGGFVDRFAGHFDAESRLTLAGMQSNLASAVIDARRGDYEPARQAASQFFTSLRAEIDKGETSNFTEAQRAGMQPLFAGRDEIITLLARSDPASADRLSDLYVAYRKALG